MSTSQFFGLNIGYTGLQAANAALNVTGNNISNVETKGYTRQEAIQAAADALRTNTSYGMAGAGVDTKSIDQIRNAYYDLKYWQNNASKGIYDIKQQYYRQIEDYFTDTDDVQGFNVVYSDMFDALDEVYKSAGDDTKKAAFLSRCKALTEYFNNMHTSLQRLQTDANNEIMNKVNEINSIASELATLNKQINTIEVNHVRANELRDKRNLLIDQLSEIVDVKVTEVPIYTTEGGTEESGIYRYIVDIAGGQNLVNSYEYSTLECVARNGDEKVNQSDADGLYDIYLTGLPLNLYGGSLGGQLKGLIEMRDGNNGENFSSKGKNGTTDLVTVTADTVTVKIDKTNPNHDFLTDMNKVTMNSAGTIVVGNKSLVYDEWQYDVANETYRFHLAKGDGSSELTGKDAYIGVSIDYQGIPYYMAQMNEWVRSFAQAMNKIERTAQYANNGDLSDPKTCESLFTCGSDEAKFDKFDYTQEAGVIYDEGGSKTVTFSNRTDAAAMFGYVDNYMHLTAGNFNINSDMMKDVNQFGTTKDITQGQDAQDITLELMKVRTDKSKMTYRGCSSEEFLQCLTSDVALGASSANNFYSNFDKISKSIVAQRTSVSGVDNDEEALNLVKFQEAYNLSSKMIQIMTEIYDRLILQTGV
ncbi:MAG: flagellar hook-associated protein FlgK [Lachnospiraceae bacterium]|nr:flagellar hook-associated protein FlgK [Lachnospiraceae bacterium]